MSFTINLFSSQATQDAGNNNSLNYNFDFNATPPQDGEYDVTFSFVSGTITTSSNAILLPVVTWGACPNAYAPTSTTGGTASQQTFALGFIRPNQIGASGQYACDMTSNVPIRITGKPTQNQFKLRLVNGNSAGNLATWGAVAYVMVIRFTAV